MFISPANKSYFNSDLKPVSALLPSSIISPKFNLYLFVVLLLQCLCRLVTQKICMIPLLSTTIFTFIQLSQTNNPKYLPFFLPFLFCTHLFPLVSNFTAWMFCFNYNYIFNLNFLLKEKISIAISLCQPSYPYISHV